MEQLEYICPPVYRNARSLHKIVCETPRREITKVMGWVRKAVKNHPFVTAVVVACISCTVGLPFLLVLSFMLLCVLIGAVVSLVFLISILFAVGISILPVLLIPLTARVGIAALRSVMALFPASWLKNARRVPVVAPLLRLVEFLQWMGKFTTPTCEILSNVKRRHTLRIPWCGQFGSNEDNSSGEDSVARLIDPEEDTEEVVRVIRRKREVKGKSSCGRVYPKTAREFIRYGNPLELRHATSTSRNAPTCCLTCHEGPSSKPGSLPVYSNPAQFTMPSVHETCSEKAVHVSSCFTHKSITIPSPAAR